MNAVSLSCGPGLCCLKNIRHVVLDLDGTIYRGQQLFPSTLPFLNYLKGEGIGFSFLTNNSSRSIADYRNHLAAFGIAVNASQIYHSTLGTVYYLQRFHPEIRKLFLLGTDRFRREMCSFGFEDCALTAVPDAVITSFDSELIYERLCKAAYWIQHGKRWIATHPDYACPSDGETLLVDCGSITACLKHATGSTPLVLGKPNPMMMDMVREPLHLQADEILMCGDMPETDLQLARNFGCFSAYILPDNHSGDNHSVDADFMIRNLGELLELFRDSKR